jgi:hypothetical protein
MTYAPPPCEVCGTWTDVLETRRHKNGTIKRRIECANLHRFTLYETVPVPQPPAVQAIDRTAGPPRAAGDDLAVPYGTGLQVHAHGAGSVRPAL